MDIRTAKSQKFLVYPRIKAATAETAKEKMIGQAEGIYNFNKTFRTRVKHVGDRIRIIKHPEGPPPDLPENARIIFFNGKKSDPSMPEIQEQFPWVKEHWR